METTQTLHGRLEQSSGQTDSAVEKRDLVLRRSDIGVKLHETHLQVSDGAATQIYGTWHIKRLFINKSIALPISEVYAISRYVKIRFIDGNGNVVAKYKRSKRV